MNISQLFEALNTSNNTLSIAEKLIGSLAVTFLSICTVFIVLIVIAAIISLLQIEKKQAKSKNDVEAEIPISEIKEDTFNEEEINDTEIVAAIMAAISAFSNNDNKLVIKKIVRNMNTKSNWELNK